MGTDGNKIDYKFDEANLINELQEYVDSTYGQHYAQDKIQATEFIIDAGHGMGFTLGNVMKYSKRYGKKDGHNRKDLLKTLHYALIALYVHDIMNEENMDKAQQAINAHLTQVSIEDEHPKFEPSWHPKRRGH